MTDNHNFKDPFGTATDKTPNRPLDITSDLWTPISTGAPLPGNAKLRDAQSTVRPPSADAKGKSTKPKTNGNAQRKRAKPGAQRQPNQKKRPNASAAKKRPAQTGADKMPPVLSKAKALHNQSRENKRRRYDLQQHKQAQRSQTEFERRRLRGDSGDDIRRGSMRRKRKKKRLAAILTVAAVLLIAGLGALVYCLAYGAPIAQIVVTGDSVYSAEEIITASGIMTGDNMFRIHARSVNNRLCSLLPYIGSVKVDYQLPDVLLLEVAPTAEVYLISGKTGYLCVDKAQKVLSQKKKKPASGQYRLDGFDSVEGAVGMPYQPQGDDKARFEAAQEIVKALEENNLQRVNVLGLKDLSDIVLRYDKRINIYLGTTKNLSVRLRAAAETLQNHVSDNTIGYLEITHEGKIYLYEGSMTK